MQLFDELDDEKFLLYAIRNYYNPICIDSEDFYEDLKRFKYIKRLLNRYQKKDDLVERLILNHLIVIFNVFGFEAGLRMLQFKLDKEHWPAIKPFLIYLKAIKNDDLIDIPMDQKVVDRLRKI